ncbi:MAG: cyclic nucleotide-binding domain-containing protein [Shimia sp.]
MPTLYAQLRRFARFEAVPFEVVALTALLSYALQINAIVKGEPLYLIAFYTLLPWIPLALFEGVWKVRNYRMVAVLGLITVLQIGHFAEHLIQVIQINWLDGTIACPPPRDTAETAARAVALGLRDATLAPTGAWVDQIARAGADGQPLLREGTMVTGPAACAIFGQLDLEIVHLVWELIGYFGTAFILLCFPRNIWLVVALAALSWHALEHLTITYFYYFDQAALWPGTLQLWATVPIEGTNRLMAVPAGQVDTLLNFYQAGGKFGLMADNGLFEQWTGFDGMPPRAELHMGYNLAITVPTVLGFLHEVRRLRSRYVERAFAHLSVDEVTRLSARVETTRFDDDAVLLRAGDAPAFAYLVKRGRVELFARYGTSARTLVGVVRAGGLVGETALREGEAHALTAVARGPVEALRLDAVSWNEVMERGDHALPAPLAEAPTEAAPRAAAPAAQPAE